MKFKYTLQGQMLAVLKTHATAALLLSFLWVLIVSLWTTSFGSYVFAVMGTVSYVLSMYNLGFSFYSDDKKAYTAQTPKLSKCAYITLYLVIVNILVIVLYKLAWGIGSNGETLQNGWAIAGNVLSMAWFVCYEKFIGLTRGGLNIVGYVLIFLLPAVSVSAGYAAGQRGIDLGGKVSGFMYEKTKKKK